jgi:serine/threonine-protein kinase
MQPARRLGRYELLFEIARGGMGTVYVARLLGDLRVERLVAIKVLLSPGGDEAARAAFLAEARITATIRHPNVVSTIELGEESGELFLVMDLVLGVSLSEVIRALKSQGEAVPAPLVALVGAQAALGLHAAHSLVAPNGDARHLIHRDVSPQNILLSFDGRVYVVDFGVAKLADNDPTTTGVIKGKFAYMSPEQAQAQSIDLRSDLFSLGIVLHEALTGQRLFSTSSPLETIRRIVEDPIRSPAKARPGVPTWISEIVMRCLARDPRERFQSAADLSNELRAAARKHEAVGDDTDLAQLLNHHLGARRDELRERIRAAVLEADRAPEQEKQEMPSSSPSGAEISASAVTRVEAVRSEPQPALNASRGPIQVLGRAPLRVAALVLLAVVGVSAYVMARRRPPAPAELAAVSSTEAVATPAQLPSNAMPSSAGVEPAAPSSSGQSPRPQGASPSPSQSARAKPTGTAGRPVAPGSARPGVPFNTL